MGFWKNLLPAALYKPLNEWRRDYVGEVHKTYSQNGEDFIVRKEFPHLRNGFFVDIGAYHPKIYSNTYYYYKLGWSGINLDANPDSIAKFKRFRKRDINLNLGVGKDEGTLTLYQFTEAALNTFSEEVYQSRLENERIQFLKKQNIAIKPLQNILEEHARQKTIHLMSIDVEGMEMSVLESNNWQKYRPHVLMVEATGHELTPITELEPYSYLLERDYLFLAKTFNTLIFRDKHAPKSY